MNNQNISRSALFQDRDLNAPAFQPRPARFTAEDESEGVELFLRGLLLTSLIVALAICSACLTSSHSSQPSVLPTHDTAVATTQCADTIPAAKAL